MKNNFIFEVEVTKTEDISINIPREEFMEMLEDFYNELEDFYNEYEDLIDSSIKRRLYIEDYIRTEIKDFIEMEISNGIVGDIQNIDYPMELNYFIDDMIIEFLSKKSGN